MAASSASGQQVLPPEDAYEWAHPSFDPMDWGADPPDATDAANWHHSDAPGTLPTEGAHLVFGNRPASDYYNSMLTGFGDAPLPSLFASLWFGFGDLNDYLSYELSGSAITVGYGTSEIDRLIVANGWGNYTLDLDVLIHDAPGLDFRIVSNLPSEWYLLSFAGTLTSHGTLFVDGYGHTHINALHGTGELIKEGKGLLRADASNYTGAVTIRGGELVGTISGDSSLTLAGGLYGFDADMRNDFERDLGAGAGELRWLAGESGGFTAHHGKWVDLTLDGGRTLTWGEEHFVSLGSELLFGSERAEGQITWHNALDLGNPSDSSVRTIRVESNVDWSGNPVFRLALSEELIATAGQMLRFIGNGTVVISADNSNFLGELEIAGVTLSLRNGGRVGEVGHFTVSGGGRLHAETDWMGLSPLAHEADITLHSSTLYWEDYAYDWEADTGFEHKLGDITITGGANSIERAADYNGLSAKSLTRLDPRSTLLVWLMDTGGGSGSLLEFDDTSAFENTAIGGIHPWLVVTVGDSEWAKHSDWGIFEDGFLKPYLNYYEGGEDTWDAGHNVNVPNYSTWPALSADRTINSLRIDGGIQLNGHTLTIGSGGILVNNNSSPSLYDGVGTSTLTTAAGRPLYLQVHGSQLSINAKLTGGMDLVKTGSGYAVLSPAGYGNGHTNELGAIYIHEGTLVFDHNTRIAATGTITVGDGSHEATLTLNAGWEKGGPPILTGKRDIRLRGGHGTANPATLHLVGEHDLRLNHLSISGNSVLEFQLLRSGGTSKIYSEGFTFDTESSRLLVRGWIQREGSGGEWGNEVGGFGNDQFTHILVRKTSPGLDDYLRQVWFEDHGPAKKIDWAEDNRYWEIVPGSFNGWDSGGGGGPPPDCPECPEPSTYGAILGAVGLGLVVWRRGRSGHRNREKENIFD